MRRIEFKRDTVNMSLFIEAREKESFEFIVNTLDKKKIKVKKYTKQIKHIGKDLQYDTIESWEDDLNYDILYFDSIRSLTNLFKSMIYQFFQNNPDANMIISHISTVAFIESLAALALGDNDEV